MCSGRSVTDRALERNDNLGGSQEIDDVIKTCHFFLPSSVKGPLCVSIALCSVFNGLLPLCSSVSLFKGPRWIAALTKMDTVHCSFCLHSVPPSSFPTGTSFDLTVMEEKDGEGGNYRLSKLRAGTANTKKKLQAAQSQ